MPKAFDTIEYLLDEYLIGKEIRNLVFLMDDLTLELQERANIDTLEIYSGSSTEGMMNGGDIDVMICQPDFIIVNKPSDVPDNTNVGVLLLDCQNCYPGFTNLLLLKDLPNTNEDLYTTYDSKHYLNKDKYMNYVCKRMFGGVDVEMHGPAVLQETGGADVVICLPCPVWPSGALEFVERKRKYELPSAAQVDHIKEAGCHVIVIAHANSKRSDIEFRISFSVAEKYLIRQWNEKQIKCYYICKELFSNHFKPTSESEKGLCSYFAKSVIFWMVEDNPSRFWQDSSTYNIMIKILDTIDIFLTERSCENYFVPNNLMMETFTEEQTDLLLLKLAKVKGDMVPFILNCDMFKKLSPNIELLCSLY